MKVGNYCNIESNNDEFIMSYTILIKFLDRQQSNLLKTGWCCSDSASNLNNINYNVTKKQPCGK